MSTVFYGFMGNNLDKQIAEIKRMVSDWPVGFPIEGIDVQVFETSAGKVCRVLEAGYGVRNQVWKNIDLFPDCSLDDRSDEPEGGHTASYELINEMDKLLAKKDYEIIVIKEGK